MYDRFALEYFNKEGGLIMKKLISICLLMLMLLSLVGCGAAKPEATVEKFFSASQKLDTETMASTIVPSNKKDIEDIKNMMSKEQYPAEQIAMYENLLGYVKGNAAKITYKVTGSEINGDKAIVTVDCKYVDVGPVIKATMGILMAKFTSMALSGTQITEEQTNQMLVDTFKQQVNLVSETYKETTVKVSCVKQNNTWYISEANEEMKDVILSGFISASKDMGQLFNESN